MILILYLRKDLSQCNAIDAAIFRGFRGLSNKKARPDGLQRSNQAAKHALLKFLRSLSDQQLFFGLALSLVTYIKMADPDGFSAYSFKMATTTIWLSCLTHISTIIALSDDKPYVTGSRGWRVAAIAVLFLLLAPMLVISNLPTFVLDPSLSFRCAWNGIPSYDREQTLNLPSRRLWPSLWLFAVTVAHSVCYIGTGLLKNRPRRKELCGVRPKRNELCGVRPRKRNELCGVKPRKRNEL